MINMNDKIEDMVANADTKPHCMVLRTEGLVKRYGKRTVVNDVSINVRQGEIVGLLGPNGAGKTTSFYMTTGLIVPNDGHIYLDDKDITSFPVYKRARAGIGYLPQEASVFRKLSVEDNIMSVLKMTKLTRKQQLEEVGGAYCRLQSWQGAQEPWRPVVGWRASTHGDCTLSRYRP